MEDLSRYRQILKNLIHDYASITPANGDIEIEAIIDASNDHDELS